MVRALVLFVVVAAGVLAAAGAADTPGDRRAAAGVVTPTPQPAGTLVFVTRANRLVAIDAASGRRTARRGPATATCGPQLHVTGGHVVFPGVRRGRTVVFSVPIALDRPPRRLGAAHAFAPSATDGRVWLAGVDCSRDAMVGVREVTVDGRVTFASRRRVPGQWLAGAARRGLVVHRGRHLALWDPRADTAVRLPLDAVSSTHGDTLAGCAARCRDLMIVDAATGRDMVIPPSRGHRFEPSARFSPDGALLAAPVELDRRWSVALVDTSDGGRRIVPGSRVRGWPELSWSASSGWLFFRSNGGRVMAYHPGAPRAVALPFRPPRRAIAFVAG